MDKAVDFRNPELNHEVAICRQHSEATSSLIDPLRRHLDSTHGERSPSAPLPASQSQSDASAPFLTFADLFAGLGGFHQALAGLGHMCVYASEIDPVLRELYRANYGLHPDGDIRLVDPTTIPDHDILCAGFPCQSFSKAGRQEGLECRENGDLISYVLRIINVKSPGYFILENVPNLERHNFGVSVQVA